MMNLFTIRGEDEAFIEVTISDCVSPDFLSSRVTCQPIDISATLGTEIRRQDLVAFYMQLVEVMKLDFKTAVAKMISADDKFQIELTLVRTGKITVSGHAICGPDFNSKVIFQFESDQSYVQETLKSLSSIMQWLKR